MNSKDSRILNTTNAIVIAVTFVLFALALVTKGFTHDLLLEAGVFLVSVKLILATYQNSVTAMRIEKKLEAIEQEIKCDGKSNRP